jgi:hypothetical protein
MLPSGWQHFCPAPHDWNSAEQTVHCIGPAGFPARNTLMVRLPLQEGVGQGMVASLQSSKQLLTADRRACDFSNRESSPV